MVTLEMALVSLAKSGLPRPWTFCSSWTACSLKLASSWVWPAENWFHLSLAEARI
jgi:hypothetical protein